VGGNFGSHTLYVGSRAGSGVFFSGKLKEFIVFSDALDGTSRPLVEANMNEYHAIY
jgi:hypothetical protein